MSIDLSDGERLVGVLVSGDGGAAALIVHQGNNEPESRELGIAECIEVVSELLKRRVRLEIGLPPTSLQ